jgi:proliferating cell nuclear antigen
MEFTIENTTKCSTFVQLFKHLNSFTDTINITLDKDKFFIQGMDNSHISIFEMNILSTWFDKYTIEQPITISIHIGFFQKILNIRNDEQTIRIYNLDSDKINIDFTCDKKDVYNNFFQLPMIDLNMEQLNIPETDYDLDIDMKSKSFKLLIDQLSNFGDVMNISYQNDEFKLKSTNDIESSMEIKIGIDDLDACSVEENLDFQSSFSIQFIHYMTQCFKISPTVHIHVSPDIPIQIKYLFDNTDEEQENTNYIRFFLAPKIDD